MIAVVITDGDAVEDGYTTCPASQDVIVSISSRAKLGDGGGGVRLGLTRDSGETAYLQCKWKALP